MKKTFISLLFMGMSLSMAAQSAITADTTAHHHETGELYHKHMMIGEIVVSGVTGDTKLKHSTVPVAVLTRQQLQAVASTNIIDAISHQPGISQITTGSGISKPVIRGLGYNRIVTVHDGVRQEGQQWGDEHGIEIDGQGISQIEVIKGPASLMYGSDALAGVLVLRSDGALAEGEMKASVSTEYQTNNGLFDYSLAFGGNKQGYVWNLRYSDKYAHTYKNKYDGYVLGSQFSERALSAMIGQNRHWGTQRLLLSYFHLTPGIVEGERDAQGRFVIAAEDEDDEPRIATEDELRQYGKLAPFQQVRHYRAVLDNMIYLPVGSLRAVVGYQQNRRQEYEEEDECGLDFKLHTVNYSLAWRLPEFSGWKINTGVNGMYQRSQNLGDEYLIPAYSLFDAGVYATANYAVGRWTLTGGLRFDNRHLHSYALEGRFNRLSRNFSALSGSVGAVLELTENWHVRFNVARGFRAPNLSELGSNGEHEGTLRYEIGNPQLKPEYSLQGDAGIDMQTEHMNLQLGLFVNNVSNFVYAHRNDALAVPDLEEGLATFVYTQGNARLVGGEASLDIHPVERIHWQNAFSIVNARLLHQPEESRWLPLTPPARWTSELSYDLLPAGKTFGNVFVKVGVAHNFRQNHFYAAYDTETATPAYTLFSAQAGTDVRLGRNTKISVYLTGENLTNCAYQNHLSRLKYAEANAATGRTGVYNMGRNVVMKIVVPLMF